MPTPATCPFCSYTVHPAKAPSGALVCPLCRNTGKTARPDSASFARALTAFEGRLVDHVQRLQAVVTRMAVTGGTGAPAGKPDADTIAQMDALAADLGELRTQHDASTTATAIRLGELAGRTTLDDVVRAVQALQADIHALQVEHGRARVPLLRQRLRALADRVAALETNAGAGRRQWDGQSPEWTRPEPWTMDEADEPLVRAAVADPEEQDIEAVPLVVAGRTASPAPAAAAATAPAAAAPHARRPTMDAHADDTPRSADMTDADSNRWRDILLHDAVPVPGAREARAMQHQETPRPSSGVPSLDHIENALHELDARLRDLRLPGT